MVVVSNNVTAVIKQKKSFEFFPQTFSSIFFSFHHPPQITVYSSSQSCIRWFSIKVVPYFNILQYNIIFIIF